MVTERRGEDSEERRKGRKKERSRIELPPATLSIVSGRQEARRGACFLNPSLGPSIYDIHTEGGGGVEPKEDVVREVA